MSVDEWYNAVQSQINWANYPAETAKILHRDIICFSSGMRHLSLRQLMIPTLILKGFQPVKLGSWPRD